ncbi:uncharacterized protein RAG0_04684 [Rhynchosporium agropyri]|uniref:Uncharacterized protein n=1 Tax=Rhynchosporium agropyri TaxID=914238 RepID=A0A1E1KDN6_9HELO|nr:uncharacterized protein RAG0_04684 [Rhynchosporium agropyri]
MAEQMGTPGSNADLSVNGSKLGAPKDKACPFCHQQFTSSSLGRHLDLYIKEKNPKPADGVHDVIEIRKLRGGITRRQPRTSTSRREDSTPAGTPAAHDRRSPAPESEGQGRGNRSPSSRRDDVGGVGDTVNFKGKPSFFINKGTWESTGVMNNIPPPRTNSDSRSWDGGEERETNRRLEPRSRSVSKQMLAKTTFEQKQKMMDALDNAKASELALRELMGSIRAAKQRIDGPSIFDYDPLTLDFPSLTLHCLPPPPTLYQSTPIPSSTSWSILPPDETQYHALIEHFSSIFHNWHVSVAVANTAPEDLSYPPPETYGAPSSPTEIAQRAEAAASSLQAKISQHLHNVYTHWTSLPTQKRSEIWILELARGVGRKASEIDKLKSERDFHKQETAHLRQQVDELSRLQHPREFKLQPPSTVPVDGQVVKNLFDMGVNGKISQGFNILDRHVHIDVLVENVIGRWKGIVKEARGNTSTNRVGSAGSTLGGGIKAQRSFSGESSYSSTNLRPRSQAQMHSQGLSQNQSQNHPQSQLPIQIQTQQAQRASAISTPQTTPVIAMDSSNLISPAEMEMDGEGSDIDADADADMDDDEGSYGNMNDSAPLSSTGFRLSSNGGMNGGGPGSGMEGLDNQLVQGYVRIGA